MPEVIFPGPDGRLEGRYHQQKSKDAPIAMILHPHPQYGGTMNNKVVYDLFHVFHRIGLHRACASTSAASAAARASSTTASASSPTPPRRSTGCRR